MNPYWLLVIPAVLALWLAEWGKVKCVKCEGIRNVIYEQPHVIGKLDGYDFCKLCHGTGRVRRRWISRLWRRK